MRVSSTIRLGRFGFPRCIPFCFRIYLIVVILPIGEHGWTQTDFDFRTFNQDDGLSNNFVLSFEQDYLGFVWIGTENGLNRFDGQRFVEFRHDPKNSESLNGNVITRIFEDGRRNLWIGTPFGLNRLNRSTGTFDRIELRNAEGKPIVFRVTAIYEDLHHNVWIGCGTLGLFKVVQDEDNGPFRLKAFDLPIFPSGTDLRMLYIAQIHPEYLWIWTSNGLYRIHTTSQKVRHFPSLLTNASDAFGAQLMPFGHHSLLLVLKQKGLFLIDASGAEPQIRPLQKYFPAGTDPNFLSTLSLQGLVDDQQKIWIVSAENLYRADLEAGTFTRIETGEAPDKNRLAFSGQRLMKDRQGNLWIGTAGGGFSVGTASVSAFRFYQHDPTDPASISKGQVRTLEEDDRGHLWVGLLGGGMDRLACSEDGQLRKIQNYRHDPTQANSLLDDRIIKIARDERGMLWIGTNGSGLNKMNPATEQFTAFFHDPDQPASLSGDRIWGLTAGDFPDIWVGTFADGLNRLNSESEKIQQFRYRAGAANSLISDKVKCLLQDRAGSVWVGTSEGVSQLDTKTGQIFNFIHDPEDTTSLSGDAVWSIYEDRDSHIWIGTNKGLSKLDRQTRVFERFYEQDGLPSNTVYGIIEDEPGNLWVSTDHGLAVLHFRSTNRKFQPFKKKDGLGSESFLPKAHFKSRRDGRLYFGATDGLVVVHPDRLQVQNVEVDLVIASLSRYNRRAAADHPTTDHFIGDKPKATFTHRDNVLTFLLADLGWQLTKRHTYEYKLEGFNEGWRTLDENMNITFTNLDPGHYRLLARGRNMDGRPLEPVDLVAVKVLPAWWKSAWAYAFYSLFALALAYLLYRFQLRRALEKQEQMRWQELDAAKSKFFTNISHEFRTPLTIISSMIDQVEARPDQWLAKGSDIIRRNTLNLLNLINQILDLRKLESQNLQLRLMRGDIVQYLRYLKESYLSYAENEGLHLHFLTTQTAIVMDYDPDKLLRIVSNLLSNAIKFNPKGGHIYFQIDQIVQADRRERLILCVRDSGEGIPPEKLPHIFTRFYQVHEPGEQKVVGSGIGLALTYELVQLMQGEIEVESEVGVGTTFTVRLPISRTSETQHPPFAPKDPGLDMELLVSALEKKRPVAVNGNSQARSSLPQLLVVEDNPQIVQVLIACLEDDYQMEIATTGQEGIDKAIGLTPDLIISDIMMPEKDGYELTATLKSDERTDHIPIVLLTAKSDADARINGLEQGADAYMAKPFQQRELLVRLKKLLELRQKLQARYGQISVEDGPAAIQDPFLRKVYAFAEEHISDAEIDMQKMYTTFGMSRSQLFRKLKALTGQSASAFIRSYRLQKGRHLLATTSLTVTEVAYKVGFTSQSYFSKAFTKEFGVPPSEIRK